MAQADTNGQNIGFMFTGTGVIPQVVNIITDGAPPSVNIATWLGSAPNALQSGRIDAYIGAIASGVIAAASFASGALDAVWSVATRTLTAFGFTAAANVTQVDGVANATHASGMLPSDVRNWVGVAPNALQSGRVDSYVGAILNGVITAASHAAGALDAVWSTAARTLTAFGFTNVSANVSQWLGVAPNALVAGKVDAVPVGHSGTGSSGTATALTLAASASAVAQYYRGLGLIITSGANAGVVRIITDYTTGKVASFNALPATADATPTYIITEIRHLLPGTDGKVLLSSDAAAVQPVWDALTSALTTSGSVGKRIADNLDAAVTTRAGFTIKRNTALNDFKFPMYDSTDHVTPLPGLTVTAERMIDSATTWTTCANSVTEDVDGTYSYDFAAADLNGASILFRFSAEGADSQFVTIVTEAA